MEILAFIAGGVLLFLGAEWLVAGASRLATRFGVSQITIGLTIVAYGTSLPEFVVSVNAALEGSGGVAMGNVIGSNICNMALILGAAMLMTPLQVHSRLLRREIPFLVLVSVAVALIVLNGSVGRIYGGLLFGCGLFFTWALFRAVNESEHDQQDSETSGQPEKATSSMALNVFLIVVGLLALSFGGGWFVDGAVFIARMFGISERVIGLSLVAFGTSVPELVTVIVAIRRGEHDIGVGNLIGSNVFNLTIVLGGAAAVSPIPFAGGAQWFDLAFGLSLPPVIFAISRGRELGRSLGGALLLSYFGYLLMLIARS